MKEKWTIKNLLYYNSRGIQSMEIDDRKTNRLIDINP